MLQMLSTVPQDVLAECARRTKERAAWLAAEEQREYKRAKLLHVMGTPCSLPAEPPAASADADAFATGVLASSPEKRPEGGSLPDGPSIAVCSAACALEDYITPQLKGAVGVSDATALPRMQQEAAAAINAGVAAGEMAEHACRPSLALLAPLTPPLLPGSHLADRHLASVGCHCGSTHLARGYYHTGHLDCRLRRASHSAGEWHGHALASGHPAQVMKPFLLCKNEHIPPRLTTLP